MSLEKTLGKMSLTGKSIFNPEMEGKVSKRLRM